MTKVRLKYFFKVKINTKWIKACNLLLAYVTALLDMDCAVKYKLCLYLFTPKANFVQPCYLILIALTKKKLNIKANLKNPNIKTNNTT